MTKLIAELGINHGGHFQNAKKLIQQAAEIGCWGIKFQYGDLRNYFKKDTKKQNFVKK